jgi:hypothetical protein
MVFGWKGWVTTMTTAISERLLSAAIAEGGQPISAGGPPLRESAITLQKLGKEKPISLFLTAAQEEAGQAVSAGGPPVRTKPQSAPRPTNYAGATVASVFILQHVYIREDGIEAVKFIGVYSSSEKAQATKTRLASLPGFANTPDGFHIDEYRLDQDHWAEGYVAVANS